MNKRMLWIIAVAVVIGLGVGAYFVLLVPEKPAIVEEILEDSGFIFPSTADEIDWDDRNIFKSGLVTSAQGYLDELPQASTYYISLEIPSDVQSGINGHQIVRYFNTEDEALSEIYFRLFPNFQGGLSEVSHLTANGVAMIPSLESSDTSLRVDLLSPLQPGESMVLEMDFELRVPTEMGGNYGIYGYFDDVLVLDTFYPMIPAYDQDGWYRQTPQENGDLTYQDASFYIVQVKAPSNLILASSGVVLERSRDNGTQTTVFAAGPARDFYLAGSTEFVELRGQEGETTVRILTRPEYSVNQELALDYGLHAIEILSEQVGEYPYTEFEVLSSPMRALGIEYPGITSLLVTLFDDKAEMYGGPTAVQLESTLVHEAVHMWFYNTVGNDQQKLPWVDEALAQYLTYIYYLERYGNGTGFVDSWRYRWGLVENADIPIGMPSGSYYGREYSGIVYGRGPLFHYQLEKDLGRDVVREGIQNFYTDFLWKNGDTEGIRAAFEEACGCDLGQYFEEWIYSN